jgi:excisionase family DNA binding protein
MVLVECIKVGMSLLTTPEAAERLGVTVTRVQQMIVAGRLPAEKMGRDYFIKEEDLKLIADRKPGRPPKAKPGQSNGKKRGKK